MAEGAGRLYVVGTPIGNLEDMSPRAIRVLSEVALVAAEDTRSARKLFTRFGIPTPTVSYFEGNEAERAPELLRRMERGEDVAVISEAGMPGISDPGERLVREAVAAGFTVEVVPGPSATLSALVASGLPATTFTFVGFPPRQREKRQQLFAGLRSRRETLVFLEAPTRLGATLADLCATLGDERRGSVAREMTKIHEEHVRAPLAVLAERYRETPPRGEITLVVEGCPEEEVEAPVDLERELDERLRAGGSPKEIAVALALKTGKPRRQIYQLALARMRSVRE